MNSTAAMEEGFDNSTTEAPTEPIAGVSVFLGVLLAILSVVTLAGNIGTIWAFKSNVLLRQKPSNLLILSLSCSDLLVGATGLPVASIHTGLGYWPLGKPVCIIAAAFSVVGVSAAMYTVTAISIDRWLLVSSEYPAYLRIQSSRNVKLQIAASWILAILISSSESILWIVGLKEDEADIHYTTECRSPVRREFIFVIVIFVLLFAIPFLVMVVSTGRFAFLLRRRLRQKSRGPGASVKSTNNAVNVPELSSTTSGLHGPQNKIHGINGAEAHDSASTALSSCAAAETLNSSSTNAGTNAVQQQQKPATKHPSLEQTGRNKSFFGLGLDASRGAMQSRRNQRMKNRYVKPAIRLAILLGVFALCTLPYPLFLVLADKSLVQARNHLSNLLLSNSGMNPFLYAIMHRKIRLFYAQKLTPSCCKKKGIYA